MFDRFGLSTILVAGSSGAYFDKADQVIQMDCYEAHDITGYAKAEARKYHSDIPNKRKNEMADMPDFRRNVVQYINWNDNRSKVKVTGLDTILINKDIIDMRYVEQLVDPEQLRMLGYMLKYLNSKVFNSNISLTGAIERLWCEINKKGFGAVCEGKRIAGNLAMPRKQELFACVNRCRQLGIQIND